MIAIDLDYDIFNSSNYKLITKDRIQKIISTNVFPKVHLLFQIQFYYLVDKYKNDYIQKKQTHKEFKKILLKMLN